MEKKISVLFSWGVNSNLYKFDSEEEANVFIKEQYEEKKKMIREDYGEGYLRNYCCSDGFAQILLDNGEFPVMEWNMFLPYEEN